MSETTEMIAVEPAAAPPQTVTLLDDENVLVIAEQPGELMKAQTALIGWTQRRLAAIKAELDEARQSLASATEHKWDKRPFHRVIANLQHEFCYYDKVEQALVAGYCIVPNFPVELVAIRSVYGRPGQQHESNWKPNLIQSGENTPAGDGRYVAAAPKVEKVSVLTDEKGNKHTTWEATQYRDVSLPIKFMKPRVLDATQAAMALNVFDEVGVLPARKKSDPLVIGRIIGPKEKQISFMIAWFIDSRDL
jgi:hypothetical protein